MNLAAAVFDIDESDMCAVIVYGVSAMVLACITPFIGGHVLQVCCNFLSHM